MKSTLYLLILIIFTALFTSCQKEINNFPECNVDNPIEELQWLKELKDSLDCSCHSSIVQGLYKGQTVYYLLHPSFYCDASGFTLWDCNGDIVKEIRYIDYDPEEDYVESISTLYTCEK